MFKIGDEVSYGLHGKCVVTGIETKELSSGPVTFYQIRSIKNPITAKVVNKNEPQILVPVDNASSKGLRLLMTKTEAETILKFISDPDYHFDLNQTWVAKQKQLEECIRKEGAEGLAKVVGHLFVMTKRDAVPPSEVQKFFQSAFKILNRELADSLGIQGKDMEPILLKAMKNKLNRDN